MNSSNFPINFSTQKSTEGKLGELHRSVTQIWNRVNRGDTAYDELNARIDTMFNNIELLTAFVNSVYGHTSVMPDTLGLNPDHDRRYITRGEVDYWDTKRLVAADSPYTVILYDEVIFCDTDAGAITINLPAGRNGLGYRIINCGSAGNDVSVVPDGSELIDGVNASKTLSDGSVIDLCYEPTEGWW
jgi:hypothetical protein